MTVAELELLEDPPNGYYELHHGELVYMCFPLPRHEKLQERLRQLLVAALNAEQWAVRTEMAFRATPEHELRRADVGVLTKERDDVLDLEYLTGAPDLVVEILSPGNTAEEILEKERICLDNGCQSFWVVNPKRQDVRVSDGDTTIRYAGDDAIMFLGPHTLRVKDIFMTSR